MSLDVNFKNKMKLLLGRNRSGIVGHQAQQAGTTGGSLAAFTQGQCPHQCLQGWMMVYTRVREKRLPLCNSGSFLQFLPNSQTENGATFGWTSTQETRLHFNTFYPAKSLSAIPVPVFIVMSPGNCSPSQACNQNPFWGLSLSSQSLPSSSPRKRQSASRLLHPRTGLTMWTRHGTQEALASTPTPARAAQSITRRPQATSTDPLRSSVRSQGRTRAATGQGLRSGGSLLLPPRGRS